MCVKFRYRARFNTWFVGAFPTFAESEEYELLDIKYGTFPDICIILAFPDGGALFPWLPDELFEYNIGKIKVETNISAMMIVTGSIRNAHNFLDLTHCNLSLIPVQK
jgi:hypothetical protein